MGASVCYCIYQYNLAFLSLNTKGKITGAKTVIVQRQSLLLRIVFRVKMDHQMYIQLRQNPSLDGIDDPMALQRRILRIELGMDRCKALPRTVIMDQQVMKSPNPVL